jgi:hypothetical protein
MDVFMKEELDFILFRSMDGADDNQFAVRPYRYQRTAVPLSSVHIGATDNNHSVVRVPRLNWKDFKEGVKFEGRFRSCYI